MLSKFTSRRALVAAAIVAAMSRIADAGCNCSVPPAPSAAVVSPMPSPTYAGQYQGQYHGYSPGSMSATAYGAYQTPYDGSESPGPHWAPGGYEPRIGSPVYYHDPAYRDPGYHDPATGQYVVTGDPYYDHFGPGFQRSDLHGHYRFPYYNYRAPWYFPGRAVYNRNTNFPW